MFIAFEGPDQVGKSTSAAALTYNHSPIYNANVDNYRTAQRELAGEPDLVQCFDRVDWFSHMVYRLSLPDREWNDARVRTVFAMPDTHLVVKIHKPELADFTAPEEVVDTPIGRVNPMYYYFADYFMALNRARGYELFKTVSIVEVENDHNGGFSQHLKAFDSPTSGWDTGLLPLERLVDGDDSLLSFLQDVDRTIG